MTVGKWEKRDAAKFNPIQQGLTPGGNSPKKMWGWGGGSCRYLFISVLHKKMKDVVQEREMIENISLIEGWKVMYLLEIIEGSYFTII